MSETCKGSVRILCVAIVIAWRHSAKEHARRDTRRRELPLECDDLNRRRALYANRDVVEYNREQVLFPRLISNEYMDRFACPSSDGTNTKQSGALFSANAEGLYRVGTVHLADHESNDDGLFQLESSAMLWRWRLPSGFARSHRDYATGFAHSIYEIAAAHCAARMPTVLEIGLSSVGISTCAEANGIANCD